MTTPEGHDESAPVRDGPSSDLTDGSAILGAVRSLRDRASTAVRDSFLYTWLTAEPEPEVIVIDLRETWTVGPIIALVDRVVAWLAPYWHTSTPKRAVDELIALGERVAETQVGQLLLTVLAPPEPPATNDAESGQTPAPFSTDTPTRHRGDSAETDTTLADSDPTTADSTRDSKETRRT